MISTLLHACSLWVQASMYVRDELLDVHCVLQLAVDLHQRGALSPTLEALGCRQCRCGRLHVAAPKLLHALSDLIAHEEHLLHMAIRHLAVHVMQDRSWTLQVLDVLRPAQSCLDVVCAIDTMKLPLWLQAHRSAILEACGGRHYLAVHRRFVRSMLSPSSHIEELTSLLHKEPPEDDPDTADSYTSCDQCTVFVPSLAVPLLPHLRHIGTFTSVRLRKARLTYHPMTPLLTACTDTTAATVPGHAMSHPTSPSWLQLAAMELHIRLGMFHYTTRRRWPSTDMDTSSLGSPFSLLVLCSSKPSKYPHIVLAPELE
ncbi:hypothetical protein AaE_010972, partial [Aphanomyces astaci]